MGIELSLLRFAPLGSIHPKKKCRNFEKCHGWVLKRLNTKQLCDHCANETYYSSFKCKDCKVIIKREYINTSTKKCPKCKKVMERKVNIKSQ